jgi:hypothetical protein
VSHTCANLCCCKKIARLMMILTRNTPAWEICLAPVQVLSFLRFEACQSVWSYNRQDIQPINRQTDIGYILADSR